MDEREIEYAQHNALRVARDALVFAILGVILLACTFLIGGALATLHLDYSVMNSLQLVGFCLLGIGGWSAIMLGRRGLRAARRIQRSPSRVLSLARTAVVLGSIEVGIAVIFILFFVAVTMGWYIRM